MTWKRYSPAILVMVLVISLRADGAVVGRLTVQGNSISSERIVRKNIRTREGEPLVEHVLNDDIRRLYGLERFEKVEVRREDHGESVDLVILLKEKPEIREVRFEGCREIKPGKLMEAIQSAAGRRYDKAAAGRDEKAIVQAYKDDGYLFAQVSHEAAAVPDAEDKVDLCFRVQENAQVRIGGVEFQGNLHVPERTLKKMMETKADRFYGKGIYDPQKFVHDLHKIRSYYQSLGYLDAKAEHGESRFSEDRAWLYLRVVVDEGPLYVLDGLEIRGNRVIVAADLRDKAGLKPGMPYSDYARLELEEALEQAYKDVGRIFTAVRTKAVADEKTAHVALQVEVEEGEEVYVERIRVQGNVKTRDEVIRRELLFFPLERVNGSLMKESRRNLMNLGFFEKVDISPELVPGSTRMADMVVRVEEKQTGSINFSIGFSSIESVFAMVKYNQRNFDWRDREKGAGGLFTGEGFMGDGQDLAVTLNTGTKSRRFTTDYQEPWVFNRKVRLGLGLFHTESSIADFDEKRDGAYTRLGREFLRDLEGFLTYTVSNIVIGDIVAEVSPAIRAQEGQNLVSSVRNDWVYDGRDNRFLPAKGLYVSFGETLAGGPFGGTQDFYKLDTELKVYKTLYAASEKEPHVLSGHLSVGFADRYADTPTVPIFERYFVGGLGTVRGFKYRSLGPRSGGFEIGGEFSTVANVEYGFPISEDVFRGVLFYDQGCAWEGPRDFRRQDLRSAVGFGLRIQVPALGPLPICLDFAHPVRKMAGDDTETFSFNFGNYF